MLSNNLLYYKIVRIGQDRARFINQRMKYEGKLFHKSSHRLTCQFGRVICNTRKKLSFLLHRKELRMLCCCAVHVCELMFAYLAVSNPFISYKSKQINVVKHSKFMINTTGDF